MRCTDLDKGRRQDRKTPRETKVMEQLESWRDDLPAEKDVAILGVEVAKFLVRQPGELLVLQDKAFHAIQIFIPFFHELLCLGEGKQPPTQNLSHRGGLQGRQRKCKTGGMFWVGKCSRCLKEMLLVSQEQT